MTVTVKEYLVEGSSSERLNISAVRALWAASREGGTEQAIAVLEPDASWRLHIHPDRLLTTPEFAETLRRIERGREVTAAQLHHVEASGDLVLAAAHGADAHHERAPGRLDVGVGARHR